MLMLTSFRELISLSEGQWISLFAMIVSLTAMLIQLKFGMMAQRRAQAETDRQIAETKKQEKLHVIDAEEVYKNDVREWGRGVVRAMALSHQLCKIDPSTFVTSDYDLKRAETVAPLRGLLDKAKWLFPNLATPSRGDEGWNANPKHRLSALEAILHAYHVLDTLDPKDPEQRKLCVGNMRNVRHQFVREMRRAVDPKVRGTDIERLMSEVEAELDEGKDVKNDAEPSPPATPIGPGEASAWRK